MIYSSGSPLDDEVVPAFCTQFLENAVQVNFHGSIAQSQFASHFLICQTASNQKRLPRVREGSALSTTRRPVPCRWTQPFACSEIVNRLKNGGGKSCAAKLPRGYTLGARAHTRGIPLVHYGPLSDRCRRSKQRTGCARRVGCAPA
jgi:hypothetical protein